MRLALRLTISGVLVLLACVIVLGLISAVQIILARQEILEHGVRTTGLVERTWKGKCGLGYGWSAVYSFEVSGKTVRDTCTCGSREWVREGDVLTVSYLSHDAHASALLVDE
jgi:hypothetical protein